MRRMWWLTSSARIKKLLFNCFLLEMKWKLKEKESSVLLCKRIVWVYTYNMCVCVCRCANITNFSNSRRIKRKDGNKIFWKYNLSTGHEAETTTTQKIFNIFTWTKMEKFWVLLKSFWASDGGKATFLVMH